MYCATVLYPHDPHKPLDFDRYANSLAPAYAEALGANCVKFEIRKGLAMPGRPDPAYALIASFWVNSREAFGASLADPRMRGVMEQIGAFTDIQPVRQFDEVVR
jgi:uncharacterized protein (TIGR02118 family)